MILNRLGSTSLKVFINLKKTTFGSDKVLRSPRSDKLFGQLRQHYEQLEAVIDNDSFFRLLEPVHQGRPYLVHNR
jgi:hypothetical protein